MDKEVIISVVGELYLSNQLLSRKLEEAKKEIEKLRKALQEFGVGTNEEENGHS